MTLLSTPSRRRRAGRDRACRWGDRGVDLRAGQRAFEAGERLEKPDGLERPIAPAERHLPDDASLDQPGDGVAGDLEGPDRGRAPD